ncbi:MAG: hypothetical protein F4120_10245 [Rhodothermaceae bacterium]|nr:hypothetical protein [Rhodothermaceae bacterium]MXW33355.1 hypothetical protein [Rhodothermaceae bacterium]MYI17979.1 hypothetical protein [Rhodothermaceae bacterium]
MDAELTLLHLIVVIIGTLFVGITTLLSVFLPLFRRSERSVEQLRADMKQRDAKFERSLEQIRADMKQRDAKIERSLEQRDAKIERSLEQRDAKIERSLEQLDAKIERLGTQIYHLNGKVNRLIGRIFGVGVQIEDDEEEMKQITVEP